MKCKKITFAVNFNVGGSPTETKTLMGIVVEERDDFLIFRTARRTYEINRKYIISLFDTREDFKESDNYETES